ncbi:MAG TPA: exodeoxyribonuclease VII large subunit, partial [Ktedonobacteraceae bacterium]|nr:exodeoxyribonuclease VII large subunit [Ktedonobacteraceae bacterium]
MLFLDAPSVLSVSQVSRYLKELLETDEILQDVWVRGEVSGYRMYSSGHCYFTLKDAEAQLPCVFFKNARMRSAAPELRDGMAIAANGRISLYERDGKLQLYVEDVELIGEGALFLRFEQLKARLAAEGLFDASRKRPLPASPSVIGIVTSPQAAALRDMLRVLRTRYPLASVILSPTLVQGTEAPAAIAGALDLLNEHGEAEVIILGRGGGSIEELWAFNDEVVARAIARSRIPVISGVGHETDFTIADFVADQRASTPTAAASAAVPDIAEWCAHVVELQQELTEFMDAFLSDQREQLERTRRDLLRLNPQYQLERLQQRLDDTSALLQARIHYILSLHHERLRGIALRLHSLSPLLTIARGYAVVRRDADQTIVTSMQQVQTGDQLTIQVTDGHIHAIVR